jgi:hypothetical protein
MSNENIQEPNYPFELHPKVIREHINFETSNNIVLDADLYKPSDFSYGQKYPILYFLPTNDTTKEQYPGIYSNNLAYKGFLCLCINPNIEGFTKEEVLNLWIEYMDNRIYVLKDNFGVVGIGDGGFTALNAASKNEKIQGICIINLQDNGQNNQFEEINLISPRALLMIIAEKPDWNCYSQKVISKAKQPKELFVVLRTEPNELFDKVEKIPFDKIERFFLAAFQKWIK